MAETSQQANQTDPTAEGAAPANRPEAGASPSSDGSGSGGAARFESSPFYVAFARALRRRGMRPELLCDPADPCARRLLSEYGAMFVASDAVAVPPVCVFRDEGEVSRFQQQAGMRAADFGGVTIELQPAALDALLAARKDARRAGLDITPRDGAEAARRDFADTVRLWESRVRPALAYWLDAGRVSAEEAAHLRSLALKDQLARVLELESCGCYFSKDFSKSILQSVAAPGASQHLALLAFDIVEFTDASVRSILAGRGWFQTVRNDLPHFTYLGVSEDELPGLGLRRVAHGEQLFWVPDLGDETD
ncbi:MAG TPA: hypothetical protein VK421_15660 [Pyrinomonadaceae bacterium]|nr:hypothetical protein [Pyrinomonadaceae bacterium]